MERGRRAERAARRRIEMAASAMPARRRAIFLAVALEEASYIEIGWRVGLDPVAVEREFARALVDLAAAGDPPVSWCRRLRHWLAARIGR